MKYAVSNTVPYAFSAGRAFEHKYDEKNPLDLVTIMRFNPLIYAGFQETISGVTEPFLMVGCTGSTSCLHQENGNHDIEKL